MTFFAIVLALLLEQARPLSPGNWLHSLLRGWVKAVDTNLDTGKPRHAWLTWAAAVLLPGLLAAALHAVLWHFSVVLTFGWSVLVLYATLGFRQFSHHFTAIRVALDAGDEVRARELLARWQQIDVHSVPRGELLRHVIESSVLAAHRHVFGVIFCYGVGAAIGLGPAGAVVYRLAEFARRHWAQRARSVDQPVSRPLCDAAAQAWYALDYLPARATAAGFAVVGSFEDAVDLWRQHNQAGLRDNDGVILASTAGAMNVRLGGVAAQPLAGVGPGDAQRGNASSPGNTTPTPGREPEPAHLAQVVGLVWRSVVLWLLILLLTTSATLMGEWLA